MFSDKNFKNLAVLLVFLLAGMLLAGEVMAAHMTQEYKKSMMEHDYAAAGYLTAHGVKGNIAVTAFTSKKDAADMKAGAALLSSAGYEQNIQNRLLPEVARFHQKYALSALTVWILFFSLILSVLYNSELRRDRQIETATGELKKFMEGNTAIRLEDCGEGSLSRLFAAVNTMATSLTAHVEKETRNREFLKNTLSDISHQLKTPLTALQMYNEIIQDEKTGNEVVQSFTLKSRRELVRMEKLIQNLLKLTRLDAGTIELEKSVCNVYTFLKDCMAPFTTRAEQEGKTLSLHCSDSVSLYIDETWLREAAVNILKNALDHTKTGEWIELSCEESAVYTEIVIRDNGSGIGPEDIHHIFKRFYRSQNSKDKQGIGIGLALSKAIVEKHGGTITVQSALGQGSEFRILFPRLRNG
jgi:signal transduction histidine kinase